MLGRLGTHSDLPGGTDVSSHMTAASSSPTDEPAHPLSPGHSLLGVNPRGSLICVQQGVRARTSTAAIHKGKSVETARVPVSRSMGEYTQCVCPVECCTADE